VHRRQQGFDTAKDDYRGADKAKKFPLPMLPL